MPGILPMKVIKVGTSAQSRIAQACDRCRSKKIRCDGITPCCTQCANVGFECKTSDKLSRRAFPRGYTESLEERVRALEAEVKELKDLLDGKDEKIDMLSKIHTHAALPNQHSCAEPDPCGDSKRMVARHEPKEDRFRARQPSCRLQRESQGVFFMGASSGRTLVDAFKARVQESDRACPDFDSEMFFPFNKKPIVPPILSSTPALSKAPPRLVSDQMINIFFQEWAPLFPVLHRPSFLKLYAEYIVSPDGLDNQPFVAQLNLVFGIAALSHECNHQSSVDLEPQWQTAIACILHNHTLATLQCLILAQLYYFAKANHSKLQHYRGIAVSICHRLGLHQSQKLFSLGTLTSETRKKVFWTQYTLDCFSAAVLGLPMLMNDGDIHTEYPADIDDENVSEKGFQSVLPGEPTRLSSAITLFRAARIMSKVLNEVYLANPSSELSLQKISALNDELEAWLQSLTPYHRLQFIQEKPSTNLTGSRSPLLSLAYHYIRILIHRPVLESSVCGTASSSIMAIASSSKHIIQIVQLLEERHMSFSFCLNKVELLLLSGLGLLFQAVELQRKGKLIQDSQKLMCFVFDILERDTTSGVDDLKRLASCVINVNTLSKSGRPLVPEAITRRKSGGVMAAPRANIKSTRKQLQVIASRVSSGTNGIIKQEDEGNPRPVASGPTIANPILYARSNSQNSVSSVVSDPTVQREYQQAINDNTAPSMRSSDAPNLDYLPFNNGSNLASHVLSLAPGHLPRKLNIERLTGYVATQQSQLPCDSLFPSTDMLSTYISPSPSSATYEWQPDMWALPSDLNNNPASAQSVLSFSEEEVTSGEELSSCETGGEFRGIIMPNVDDYGRLDGFDGFGC